ncbi:MAG TPA: integrase arm-type DNA-binding domain-containing protein [Xanthobacteraceae bacterium]|nr:integrase arm-type DNA-binding domain-containing protein [Xanthobacteraceae bacterium]
MALTDTTIRNLKPQQKPYKKSDSGGLQLHVMPEGSRLWRLAYRFAGKQKTIALGSYPAVTLAMAREAKDEARRLLAQGVDPSEKRKADKRAAAAARTFGEAADEWFATKRVPEEKSEATLERDRWLMGEWKSEIGHRPIGEIEPPELLPALKRVAARKHYETASRMRTLASQVFRFGVANGYCQRDAAADLKGALTSPKSEPRPGLTDPAAVGKLCRAINSYIGKGPPVGWALRLLSLTLVRPGEVAKAEWSEIDFERRVWTIPAAKMKMRRDHQVPLSQQALDVLLAVKARNGNRKYVFATFKDKPLSGNTFNTALRILGYDTQTEHCAHGFRTTASTLLNEERGPDGKPKWHPDVIELQLAHVDANNSRAAYNRAQYWPDRVRLMQHWADRLDKLRSGAQVVTLSRQAAG